LKAPEQLVGKSVKCPGCSSAVLVQAAAAPAASPKPAAARQAAAPVKKKVIDDLDEVEDIEEIEEVRPSRKGAITKKPSRQVEDDFEDLDEPRPKKKKVVDDYDDDEDDRPKKKAKGRDEDEDEDRPKKKGKKGAAAGGPTTENDRQAAFMFYVIAFVGAFIGIGPIGGIVWWLMKRGESRFVDHHGKQYINVAITQFVMIFGDLLIFGTLAGVLGYLVSPWAGLALGGLGGLLAMGVALLGLICFIKGILAARAGDWYKPPMTWQLLK